MSLANKEPDILIIGGGNAALCAAITAAELGANVLVLESAPKFYRGGNSRHTRNFRCMHKAPTKTLIDSYETNEYFEDLLRVTKGNTDQDLASLVIESTEECLDWMKKYGVHFQPSLTGTLSLGRTNAFFMGGGKALVNAYYRSAETLGVQVIYDATVTHVELEQRTVRSVNFKHEKKTHQIYPRTVVVASGGFQGDIDWLERAWGPAARNFLIRGAPYNRGIVLKDLLDQGVESVGDPTQCHAVAIDGRAPKFDGGIVTRLDCVPFSVVINKHGARFYDEGEDVWPKRYAIWGRLVAAQDDQVAYAIIDADSLSLFMPSVFPPIQANSIKDLSQQLDLNPLDVSKTISTFNQACSNGKFTPTELDGLRTNNLIPAKTNWARPIVKPPFYAYSLRPGVTFTYLGLKVDHNAQVQHKDGPIQNLWAAGEVMAGSILGEGYLAGFGMAIGTVFGRIAGKQATIYARNPDHE